MAQEPIFNFPFYSPLRPDPKKEHALKKLWFLNKKYLDEIILGAEFLITVGPVAVGLVEVGLLLAPLAVHLQL